MTTMTTREVLRKAAAHIEEYEWDRLRWGSEGNACCAVGAIQAVLGHGYDDQWYALRDAATESLRGHVSGEYVTRWNGTPGRTKDEVIAALLGAADACEVGR